MSEPMEKKDKRRVDGKKVLVTGGGGASIGRAISILLAEEGATVMILDIDSPRGEEVAGSIRKRGGKALYIQADVTKTSDIDTAVVETIDKVGEVDVLVNNVGGAEGITLDKIDKECLERNLASNLTSAMLCTRAVIPHMIRQRSGSIIYVSSINALLGGLSEVAYAASKGALHSLVRSLTGDYSRQGLRFNVVCPGSIDGGSALWQNRERGSPGLLKQLAALYPIGRMGVPQDVAYAVLFFASDESSWISGVVLPVDGGLTATGALPGGKWWERI